MSITRRFGISRAKLYIQVGRFWLQKDWGLAIKALRLEAAYMYAIVWVALVVFRFFSGSAMIEEEPFTDEQYLIEIPIESRWLAI